MKKWITLFAIGSLGIAGAQTAAATPADNATLVRQALNDMFVKRDQRAAERYFSPEYIQHNPRYPSGRAVLPKLIGKLPARFKFEMGMVVALGDLVMDHNRYTGIAPTPMIAVDIYRVQRGKIVEHWDVLQEETPTAETKSGKAMFTPGER